MNLRMFLTVTAAVTMAYAIVFLLFPEPVMALYGITLNEQGIGLARLLGAALLGVGAATWFARDLAKVSPPSVRPILMGNLVGAGMGLVVFLLAQLSPTMGVNALGWSSVAIYLLFTLGNAYFLFIRKQ